MKVKFYQNLLIKNLAITVVAGVAFCSNLMAQGQTPAKCGNDPNVMANQYPDFWKVLHEFETNWEHYKNSVDLTKFDQTTTGKYVIPVVVHVLHTGGSENITRAQIVTQINQSNKDFRMENNALAPGLASFAAFDTLVPYFNGADTVFVIHGNDTSALLSKFEFRLATLDPFGNCTDGVTRTYTEKSELAGDYSKFKQVISWDRAKYFNIWIVNDILGNTPGQTTLGYAQFPFAFGGQFPLTSTDGITIIHNFFGTSGTASGGTGATTTHEAGHWLGLFHIWGDADCGSDGIGDTPIHFGPDFCTGGTPALNTPAIHCPPYLPYTAECYVDTNSTDTALNQQNLIKRFQIGRMWMNFMDYTDDQYLWMFSEEQYRKMNLTMETISFRGSLSTASNLVSTGTDDASISSPCYSTAEPIADLWSTSGASNYIARKLICEGGSLTFTDGTFNLSAAGSIAHTRLWDFPGGTPTSSTTSPQVVTYNTAGDYDVTITSTNTNGTSTKTRDDYVHVSSNTADEANYIYYDDFEYSTSLYEQGKWITIGQGWDASSGWEQATNTGYLSSKCAVMRSTGSIQYEKDFLITPSFDMTTMTNEKLYFKFAGARRTASPYFVQKDQLRVYVSTNCGSSWSLRPVKIDGVSRTIISGDTLYSAGLFTSGFVPTASNQWNEGEVDLNVAPYNTSTNLRIMFEWTSGTVYFNGSYIYGNDFYIDQINITNSTAIGIEDNDQPMDYSLYPNPVTETSQIYFKLPEDAKVTLDVLDITGRVVRQIYNGNMQSGPQYFQIHNADFNAAGVYMVRLNVNGEIATKKIIVE